MKSDRVILQTFNNVQAGLGYHGLLGIGLDVVATQTDRVLLRKAGIEAKLAGSPQFDEWKFNQNHGATAYRGFRERVAWCSMQLVLHETGVVEIDFDLCNPDFGVLPAIGHLIEILWPGKTDPFRVRKGLLKRGMNVELAV